MRTRGWALAAAVGLAGWAAAARTAETPVEASAPSQRLQRLVARLGSNLFRERETATRELDDLGPAALDSLRQAARDGDAETRRRAATLIDRITARQTTARILAPTLVELDYHNTPLAEAVRDLARRTGAPVALHGDLARYRGRTVTLSTGKVPLWEAVEQFCRKADLHEWDGGFTPLPGVAPQHAVPAPAAPGLLPQGQVIIGGRVTRSGPVVSNQILLLDGPGTPPPAHHAGAVRVRCLPPGTPFPVAVTGADDVILPLQLSAEPRLGWQGALELRVDRAVDDQGQALKASAVKALLPTGESEMLFLGNGMLITQPAAARGGLVGVRLTRGAKPAKRLAALAGRVAAQVRVTEPLVTVEAPLQAAGRYVRGTAGVTLRITEVERTPEGDVKLTAAVQLPLDVQLKPSLPGLGAVQGAVQIQNGVVIRQMVASTPAAVPAGTTEWQGLALEDAQGHRFAVTAAGHEANGINTDGYLCTITATFRPPAKGREPAKLVFTANRPVTVEVPFAFKDVPLP
jgi:hypothetical protein